MRAATHLATAGLTGVIATGFGADLTVASGAALAVGSLLPDIDTQHSGLGRLIKPLSGRLERTFGHRTITHSLLGGKSRYSDLTTHMVICACVGVVASRCVYASPTRYSQCYRRTFPVPTKNTVLDVGQQVMACALQLTKGVCLVSSNQLNRIGIGSSLNGWVQSVVSSGFRNCLWSCGRL